MDNIHPIDVNGCSDLYYVKTGMFGTNEYGGVYIFHGDKPAIIETGVGTGHDKILESIEVLGINREDVQVIIVTHVHLDHAGGAGFLIEALPNANVYVSSIGAPHLIDPSTLISGTKQATGDQWEHFYITPKPIPKERVVELEDGDEINIGTHRLKVHKVPGHAPHQVILEDPINDMVFTGDAAGIWLPSLNKIEVTSPPPNFNFDVCVEDIKTIKRIDPSTLCYTHAGARRTGYALERYEMKLTKWVKSVETKRAELATDKAVADYFADRTELTDIWGEIKAREEVAMNAHGVMRYLDWKKNAK